MHPKKLETHLKDLLEKIKEVKANVEKTDFFYMYDVKDNLKIMEEISENIHEMHSHIGGKYADMDQQFELDSINYL